ncbi:MAG: GDSL-type esterase/lipase family protein [Balneolaceae bacterium]
MLSKNILTLWFLTIMVTACQETPNSNTIAPAPPAIEQIADLIEGQQGDSITFYLGDYFRSESPITSAEFNSDSVTIQSISNDSFRITQPDNLSGEFLIEGELINEDNQELNSELTYLIEPEPEPEIPPSDGVLVIMPLGDSLTNDGRSRATLWNLLTDDGHELDYVGDQKQSGRIPDDDHEGVGGITIEEVAEKAERLMNTHQPEYILLMLGTNNIAWYINETAEEIAERWDDLVQLIFDSSEPGTYIIAATIPPVTSKLAGHESLEEIDRAVVTKMFNAELRIHISNRKENGDNIILADVEKELNLEEHVAIDGVHLNESGYEVMGTVYYEAMNSVLREQNDN